MNNLTHFDQFITEGKQVGILYHFTELRSLESILRTDCMFSMRGYISFTRNKNLNYLGRNIKIIFDGSAMSNEFAIEPFAYRAMRSYRHEAEERIQTNTDALSRKKGFVKNEIAGVVKYILAIEINLDRTDENQQYGLKNIIQNNPQLTFVLKQKGEVVGLETLPK